LVASAFALEPPTRQAWTGPSYVACPAFASEGYSGYSGAYKCPSIVSVQAVSSLYAFQAQSGNLKQLPFRLSCLADSSCFAAAVKRQCQATASTFSSVPKSSGTVATGSFNWSLAAICANLLEPCFANVLGRKERWGQVVVEFMAVTATFRFADLG